MYEFMKYDEPIKKTLDELEQFEVFRTSVGCDKNRVNAMFLGAQLSNFDMRTGKNLASFTLDIKHVPVHEGVKYMPYYCNSSVCEGLVTEDYKVHRAQKMCSFINGRIDTPLKETFSYQAQFDVIGKLVKING